MLTWQGFECSNFDNNLVCTWRHKILKSKLARPAKFLPSPGVGTPKNKSFHKFPARYHLLCLKYSILNFRNCPARDIKMAPWQGSLVWKKVFSDDFWHSEQFKYWEKRLFMYTSSQGLSNRSHIKSEFQMFSLMSGRLVGVPRKDTNMASAYWALYSTNNSRTVYRTDLRLGEVVYLLIFCNIWNS